MEITFKNVSRAILSKEKFAQKTSNSGRVEFTLKVRGLLFDFYDEINSKNIHGDRLVFFIMEKLNK